MQKWRLLAIILCLVWIIVLISQNYATVLESTPTDISLFYNLLLLTNLALSVLWAIFPSKFSLYGLLCCFIGLESLFTQPNGSTNGLLMYVLGCCFANKIGVLFKNKVVTTVFIVLPLLAIASQVRISIEYMVRSFIDLLFLVMFFILSWFLLKDTILEKGKELEKKNNKIDANVLTPYEQEIVKEVLANKTFSAIAREKNKSESSIKMTMADVYTKLNIKSKKELMELHHKGFLQLTA